MPKLAVPVQASANLRIVYRILLLDCGLKTHLQLGLSSLRRVQWEIHKPYIEVSAYPMISRTNI